jgi:hypothetical protein
VRKKSMRLRVDMRGRAGAEESDGAAARFSAA